MINSLDLIPLVQRQWRTLQFSPVLARAAKAATGASEEAAAIMQGDIVAGSGFIPGLAKVTHRALVGVFCDEEIRATADSWLSNSGQKAWVKRFFEDISFKF